MAVWERGAGRTLACGTGACALVVAGVLEGRINRSCRCPFIPVVAVIGMLIQLYYMCCFISMLTASSLGLAGPRLLTALNVCL